MLQIHGESRASGFAITWRKHQQCQAVEVQHRRMTRGEEREVVCSVKVMSSEENLLFILGERLRSVWDHEPGGLHARLWCT